MGLILDDLTHLDSQSCNDMLGNKAANEEAVREDAVAIIIQTLADGDKVLFDDGTELQLNNETIDSFIRQARICKNDP